ncbi:MAG: hypothetical protein P4M11_07580 [Candidatus Pacebacteria bacterium]|nr:hypothetical protein [Candidatus Paceibacterota bacterium]
MPDPNKSNSVMAGLEVRIALKARVPLAESEAVAVKRPYVPRLEDEYVLKNESAWEDYEEAGEKFVDAEFVKSLLETEKDPEAVKWLRAKDTNPPGYEVMVFNDAISHDDVTLGP